MAFTRHHDTGTRTSPRGERTGVVRPTLTEEWLLIKPPNPENFLQFPYCCGRPLENQRGSDMVVGFGESRRYATNEFVAVRHNALHSFNLLHCINESRSVNELHRASV